MTPEGPDEVVLALRGLIDQMGDESVPVVSRIAASVQVNPYLEAFTRRLVDEAREEGASWDDLAHAFGTSPQNVKSRFGSYRDYDD
ncbi:MAG: hypothetical protein M3179_13455 [Actinomycetota bacterium]|nr:hypothetical protein [Actinomycetota bacterium]